MLSNKDFKLFIERNAGLFEKSLIFENFTSIDKTVQELGDDETSLCVFKDALLAKVNDIYLRSVDLESGDSPSINSVHNYTKENLQKQLNTHHFGSKSENNEQRSQQAYTRNQVAGSKDNYNWNCSLEDIVNLCGVKQSWKVPCVAFSVKSKKSSKCHIDFHVDDPEMLARTLLFHEAKNEVFTLILYRNLKGVNKTVEGFLLLLNSFAEAGVHNPSEGKNSQILAISMSTFSGRKAYLSTLSALTRNGIQSVTPNDCTLAEIMYEDCVPKMQRILQTSSKSYDVLRHPLSRVVCGMPSGLGVSSFDLVSKKM